jgi:hypothetical protein
MQWMLLAVWDFFPIAGGGLALGAERGPGPPHPPKNPRITVKENHSHRCIMAGSRFDSSDTTASYSPAAIMATSRDTPNPLRPYYITPSIGLPPENAQNGSVPSSHSYPSKTPRPSFGSQARDILSDIDYADYFPEDSPSLTEHAKRVFDQALWNYTSVLLAQPFEVAKTILQVHHAAGQAPAGLPLNGPPFGTTPNSSSAKYDDVSCQRICANWDSDIDPV